MNIQSIINHVADEADDLLGGCATVEEARLELQDHVKRTYPTLTGAELRAAVTGVLSILKEEGFFESSGGGERLAEDGADGFSEANED